MTQSRDRKKRRVLVTGAGGLIGGETCRLLFDAGYDVLALYRSPSGVHETFPWTRCYLDLEEEGAREKLEKLLPLYGIVHCAAVIPSVFQGEEAEKASARNKNIDLVMTSLRAGTRKFIYCSSSSVYRVPYAEKVDESFFVEARGAYQKEKITMERECLRNFLENAFVFRICAPYGSRQKNRTVLKMFIENAMEGRSLLYHGSGGRQQDFTHVRDVAMAVLCSLEPETRGGIFNVAGGAPITMKNLAELVVRLVPDGGSKVFSSGQPDPQEGWTAPFCIDKARLELGWTPRVSLEEGIRDWADEIRKGMP